MVPIIEPAISMLRDFVSVLVDNKDTVKAVLGIMAVSFGAVALAIAPIPIAIGLITAGLGILGHPYSKSYASSFLDGLGKIGNGFSSIAEMAGMASGDVKV